MTRYSMSINRSFGIRPGARQAWVRVFKSEPGAIPEVVATGKATVSRGEVFPVDAAYTKVRAFGPDGTAYEENGPWEPLQHEYIADAKVVAQGKRED